MAPRTKKSKDTAMSASSHEHDAKALTQVAGKKTFKTRRGRTSTPLIDITNQVSTLPTCKNAPARKGTPVNENIETNPAQSTEEDLKTLLLKGQALQAQHFETLMSHISKLNARVGTVEAALQLEHQEWPERAAKLDDMHDQISSIASDLERITEEGLGNTFHEAHQAIDEIKEAVEDRSLSDTYNMVEAIQGTVDQLEERVVDMQGTVDSYVIWFRHIVTSLSRLQALVVYSPD